jgi:transcriptional regulator with XRE-family HTH domain
MTETLNLIKELRVQNGFSQEYMAAKLKTTQSNYSRIEQGRQNISAVQFLEVLSILNMDIEKIITYLNNQLEKTKCNFKYN